MHFLKTLNNYEVPLKLTAYGLCRGQPVTDKQLFPLPSPLLGVWEAGSEKHRNADSICTKTTEQRKAQDVVTYSGDICSQRRLPAQGNSNRDQRARRLWRPPGKETVRFPR